MNFKGKPLCTSQIAQVWAPYNAWRARNPNIDTKRSDLDFELMMNEMQEVAKKLVRQGYDKGELDAQGKEISKDYDMWSSADLRKKNGLLTDEEVMAKLASASLHDLLAWNELSPERLKIAKNEHTRSHKVIEAIVAGQCSDVKGNRSMRDYHPFTDAQFFVVKHDWAGVLGPAISDVMDSIEKVDAYNNDNPATAPMKILRTNVEGGSFKLPYPNCVFEFMVDERCMLLKVVQEQATGHVGDFLLTNLYVQAGDWWYVYGYDTLQSSKLFDLLWRQILAISVVLDSKVAETVVVNPNGALNKKRLKNKKPPLYSYHVVDLALRHRYMKTSLARPYQGVVRLHFRRAHDRTYEKSGETIRIEWTLVGNPDLGFIDKHYRL